MKNFVRILFGICVCLTLWIPFTVMDAYLNVSHALDAELKYDPSSSTKIFDVNGVLISELYIEKREILSFDKISPAVKKAFLSAEDSSFYVHRGYNVFSMLRAAYIDLTQRGKKQGGSTITQQLAKQLYTGSEKTLIRKIGELFIAIKIENKLDKDKIFEMYLNHIYFGHGAYGVKAASDFYFNADASQIGIAESAILASIPSSPNNYSPLKNPKIAHERASALLKRMYHQKIISKDELDRSLSRLENLIFVGLAQRSPGETVRHELKDRSPHFTEYIRKILIKNYGEDVVYHKGLNVYTTLDLRVQEKAELHIKDRLKIQTERSRQYNRMISIGDGFGDLYLKRIKDDWTRRDSGRKMFKMLSEGNLEEVLMMCELFGLDKDTAALSGLMDRYENVTQQAKVEAAFISIDPFSGAIVAMIGGSDTRDGNQFNRAVQSLRQPGSAFKIFVYAAGIESNSITAATQLSDLPMVFHEGRREWVPSNYGKDFSGIALTRKAVAASINTSSVAALDKIGPKKVIEFAAKVIGIPQKRFHDGHSLALGTSEMSPIEMACGISAFANGGYKVEHYAIKKITDNQSATIYEYVQPPKKEIMKPSTAYIMTAILRGVVDQGTAQGGVRRDGNFHLPAAGKTGTNTKLRDAWFAGYTPDLASVIWIGCNSQNFSLGYGGAASELAAPIWGKIMRDVYTFRERGAFPKRPQNVEYKRICTKSGNLHSIGLGCSGFDECFVKGTAPVEICDGEHIDVLKPVSVTKGDIADLKEKMQTKSEEVKKPNNNEEEFEVETIDFD